MSHALCPVPVLMLMHCSLNLTTTMSSHFQQMARKKMQQMKRRSLVATQQQQQQINIHNSVLQGQWMRGSNHHRPMDTTHSPM